GPQGTAGAGVWGESTHWEGVHGIAHAQAAGVAGVNDGPQSGAGAGVWGESTNWEGVHGIGHARAAGVAGYNDALVNPQSPPGAGVFGHSDNGPGMYGETNGAGAAVVGVCKGPAFDSNDGVLGICGAGGNAIHGRGGTNAGLFEGTVVIQGGSLQVSRVSGIGGESTSIFATNKHFVIDHPCDPANRYLFHCSVESPERMNVYSGNITTNHNGKATVILPDYFEALNGDYRYQLTVIGQLAHAVVESEITNNCLWDQDRQATREGVLASVGGTARCI